MLEQIGLTGQRIAHEIVGLVAGLGAPAGSGAAAAADSSKSPKSPKSPKSSESPESPNGKAPKVTAR